MTDSGDNNQEAVKKVTEHLRNIVRALINKQDGFDIKTKKANLGAQVHLYYEIICHEPKDVGLLLGNRIYQPRTKTCLIKIMSQIARHHNIAKIELAIDDINTVKQRSVEADAT